MTSKNKMTVFEQRIGKKTIQKVPMGLVSAGLFKGMGMSVIESKDSFNPEERTMMRRRERKQY